MRHSSGCLYCLLHDLFYVIEWPHAGIYLWHCGTFLDICNSHTLLKENFSVEKLQSNYRPIPSSEFLKQLLFLISFSIHIPFLYASGLLVSGQPVFHNRHDPTCSVPPAYLRSLSCIVHLSLHHFKPMRYASASSWVNQSFSCRIDLFHSWLLVFFVFCFSFDLSNKRFIVTFVLPSLQGTIIIN